MPTFHPLAGEPDPESLMTCPYNSSHRVSRKRIQFHLTKCRKSHPDAKKETCPYNATHLINEQEFQFHLEVCPNKGIIDSFKYTNPSMDHVIELPPEPVVPPAEENWDDDNCATYDPTIRLAEEPIIYTFIGGTKSERKKCRIQQRQKFRALDETVQSVKVDPKDHDKKPMSDDDQPLRPPHTLPKNIQTDSTQYASFGHSSTSGISNAVASTSKVEKELEDLNDGCSTSTPVRVHNLASSSVAEIQNRPGPSRNRDGDDDDDDDDFIIFNPKGRGKFRN